MPVEIPQGDLSRTTNHEPDYQFPEVVRVELVWKVGSQRRVRSFEITAAQFFGHGANGAPLSGEAVINHIERLRRQGPPGREKD